MQHTVMDVPASKIADVDHEILDLFRTRWSPRAFADRPVEPEKIQRMLEAARWTMSSYNEQPWRYLVATKETPEAHQKLLQCLTKGNREWARLAPVLMLAFYKTTFSGNDERNRVAKHDLGAASAALTFQATAMGLCVHQMAGIQRDVIRDAYDVPEEFEPATGIAVGYLGDPEQLPEGRREAERRPRSRMPLSEFVFEESWDQSADLLKA